MTPALVNSLPMRRVEYPDFSRTNFCPDGVTGTKIDQASHPQTTTTTNNRNKKKRRKVNSSLDDMEIQVVGRWSLAVRHIIVSRFIRREQRLSWGACFDWKGCRRQAGTFPADSGSMWHSGNIVP